MDDFKNAARDKKFIVSDNHYDPEANQKSENEKKVRFSVALGRVSVSLSVSACVRRPSNARLQSRPWAALAPTSVATLH